MTDIGVEIQDERGWVVVATPLVVMLVHASEGEPRVASLRAVAEDGSIDDVLQILTEGGILETPDFVAIESGTPVRVVARGGGYAVLTSREADSPREVRATGRAPWADEDAPADLAHVSLRCVPSVTRPTGYVASTAPATLAGAIAESAAQADRYGPQRADHVGETPSRADGEPGRAEPARLESARLEPSGPVAVEGEADSLAAMPEVQSMGPAAGGSLDVHLVESPATAEDEEPTVAARSTPAPGGAEASQQSAASEISAPAQPRDEAQGESPPISGESVELHPWSAKAGAPSREEGVVASPFVERTPSWSPVSRPVQAASRDNLANGDRPRAATVAPEPSDSTTVAGHPSSVQEPAGLVPPAGPPPQPPTSAPAPAPAPLQPGQLSGAGQTTQTGPPTQGGEPPRGGQPSQVGQGPQAARLDQAGQPPPAGEPPQAGRPLGAGQPQGAGQPPGPQVLAVTCPAGHPNPPHLSSCRLCQQHIPPQQPVHVPRPPLGVLRLSTGDVVTLDRGVVLGRWPQLRPDVAPGSRPHVLRLPSPQNDISRTHAEVVLEGWHVMVRDLGSTNGTTVTLPGYEPARLRPTDQPVLEPGTVVTLADEITMTYEVGL